MSNLLAIRRCDNDYCGCCGCGKDCKVSYEILGRDDLKEGEQNCSIFLCFRCYRPLRKAIELSNKGEV